MKFWSDNFKDGEKIPREFTFAKPSAVKRLIFAKNHNPRLAWSGLPEGTQSLVLTVQDQDWPEPLEENQPKTKTIPLDHPRRNFFHWILVDLPPKASPIEESEFSDRAEPHGKGALAGPRNTRQGINDFTGYFKDDGDMDGNYFGYDGPHPASNDERTHRYLFTLYALKEKRCPVRGPFTGPKVLKAIDGLILDKAQFTGLYSTNPKAKSI